MNKQDRRVFSTLDGLRGLAALAVVTRHVPDRTFLDLLPGSALAVDLLFALSGFVLAHSYTERLRGEMRSQRVRGSLHRYLPQACACGSVDLPAHEVIFDPDIFRAAKLLID